nr:MAG TPA: Tape measure domain protein [Bacteriophage sp.]
MAVEIPVVIDIDKAFDDAIKKLPSAMRPLKNTIEQLSQELNIARQIMAEAPIDSKDWQDAANMVKGLSQSLEVASDKMRGLVANDGSIKQMTATLASLNRRWEEMGYMQKFQNASQLSGEAKALYAEYKRITKSLQQNKTLTQLWAEEQAKAAKAAERQAAATKAAQDKAFMMSSPANTLAGLRKQETLLSAAMGQVTIGSAAFRDYENRLTAVRNKIKSATKEQKTYNTALSESHSRLGTLIKSTVAYFSLRQVTNFLRNIRAVTAEFEMQRVALGGIIQDSDKASELFKQIKAAAIKSPFEIKDLVSYTKQLSAYRIETDQLFETTQRLADVSSGLGVDMGRIILAYGQVRAASVLRGTELRQFTEAGIPLVELLAEKFSQLSGRMVNTAEVFDLISKRAVSFKMIKEIFEDMTNAGGMFYKMQEKQSETLQGKWMNLKDSVSIMYDEIGNTKDIHTAMEWMLSFVTALMNNWRTVGKVLGGVIASMTAYKIAVTNTTIAINAQTAANGIAQKMEWSRQIGMSKTISLIFGETAARKIQIALMRTYVAVKAKEVAATNLFTKAFYKMTAALLKNPYALAIAGITALGYGLYQLMTNANKAKISVDDFEKSLESFKQSKSHAKDIDDLCAAYDELNKKTDKTAEEQKKLERITKDLAKAYPSAVAGVDMQTGALKINTKAIKSNNEAVKEAIKLALTQDKTSAEAELAKREAERDKIARELERGKVTRFGPYNTQYEGDLTEEERAARGRRITELEAEIKQYSNLVEDAEKQLEGYSEEVGVWLDFFDDKWRLSLTGYSYTLQSTGQRVRAFTKEQIENFTSLKDALDAAAKGYKEQKEAVEFYTHAYNAATGGKKDQMKAALADAQAQLAMYTKILTDNDAMYLTAQKGKGGASSDPFIIQIENRIKFMKDFQKGYESLLKYMSSSAALQKEGSIMQGRGVALGIDPSEQKRAATDLSGWLEDLKKTVFAEAQKKGAKGDILDFLGLKIKSGVLREYQSLIQSIFDTKTDIDTSQMSRNFDKAIKQLSTELKNTEAARNFYKDILGQTGDELLAQTLTISVYGDIGKDFKERIQSQLDEAFKSLSKADQTPEMKAAIDTQDFAYILSNLDKFSQEWQKVLQEAASSSIQYNAKWLKDLVSSYEKHKTFEERITETKQREAQQRVEIQKWEAEQIAAIDKDATKTTEEKTAAKAKVKATSTQMQAASTSKEAKEVSNIEMEALKATYEWTKAFEDMDNVSTTTLKNLIALLTSYIDKWKDSGDAPESLKAAVQALEQAQAQITERNPYQGAIKGIKDYIKAKQTANRLEKEGKKGTQEYKEAQDAMRKAMKSTEKSVNDVGNTFNTFSSIVSSVSDILNLDEMSDGEAVLQGIAAGLTMVGTALVFINAMFTLLETNPIVLAISAIIASVAALGMIMSNLSTAKANREIENQQVIVDNLEKSYKRLEKAMEDSFGSDYIYNYNEQMKNLQAQADAYQKMADAERSKGRKADDDKIKEYEESMDDILEKMDDMKHQLSEYFSGTDLTSAAEDFAKSWIDAYREFSSTTSAMKEKFKEMIDNMIIKSVAGQIMQKILKPVFDAIETYSEDGELSVEDIAKIADMTTAVTDDINASFTALMERFTAAGMNIRATGSSLSGISKDIAGASEESINALASGINTQNFYMSYMPNIDRNVAAILVAIQGGTTPNTVAAPQTTSVQFGDETFRGQMSRIDENVAGIYQMMRSVITPKSANINTHCVGTKS